MAGVKDTASTSCSQNGKSDEPALHTHKDDTGLDGGFVAAFAFAIIMILIAFFLANARAGSPPRKIGKVAGGYRTEFSEEGEGAGTFWHVPAFNGQYLTFEQEQQNGRKKAMKFKMMSAAALALVLSAGAAMGQASTSGGSDAAPSVLSDPATMKPFFSDEAMATLKSDEEVKAAFNALPAEQQKQMKSECQNATDAKYKDFCAKIGTM